MKFRVTSVASEEVAPILRVELAWLEDALNERGGLLLSDVGIDRFVIVFVAVDGDCSENSRFAKRHQDAGRYKDIKTDEEVRFISIAVELDPSRLMALGPIAIKTTLVRAVSDRLDLDLSRETQNCDASDFLIGLLSEIRSLRIS